MSIEQEMSFPFVPAPLHLFFLQVTHTDKERAKSSLVPAAASGDAGFSPDFSKLLLLRRIFVTRPDKYKSLLSETTDLLPLGPSWGCLVLFSLCHRWFGSVPLVN